MVHIVTTVLKGYLLICSLDYATRIICYDITETLRGVGGVMCLQRAMSMRTQSSRELDPRACIGQAVQSDGRSRMRWLAVERLVAASHTEMSSVSNRLKQLNAGTYVTSLQRDKQSRSPTIATMRCFQYTSCSRLGTSIFLFHEDLNLVGYDAVWSVRLAQMFRRILLPPYSRWMTILCIWWKQQDRLICH
jgi:hypothetical protein